MQVPHHLILALISHLDSMCATLALARISSALIFSTPLIPIVHLNIFI